MLTLKQRQSWQLACSDKASPLTIAVQAFCCILFSFFGEDLFIEELLQTFIAIVDEKLLESIRAEHLKAI
jgi:hypothetical protein